MATYCIYRMKENARQQFRWAPHTIGTTKVKPKDYDLLHSIEAPNVYTAWSVLRESDQPLEIGDILEVEGGELRIYKYVGFEEAEWQLPEPKAGPEGTAAAPESSAALAP